MKKVIKNQKKMKNAMYIVFGTFALALFAITRINPSYADNGLVIDDALDAIVLYGEVETSTDEETLDESQDEEKEIPEVENEGDEYFHEVPDDEEDVDGDEINTDVDGGSIDSNNVDNADNNQEEKGEESEIETKNEQQPEIQNPEVPSIEDNHGVDNKGLENDVVEDDNVNEECGASNKNFDNKEIGEQGENNKWKRQDTNLLTLDLQKLEEQLLQDFTPTASKYETIYITGIDGTLIQTNNQEWEDFEIYYVSNTGNVSNYTLMDRNLGATTSDITSEESYGYYYQRGNNYGFNEKCKVNGQTSFRCGIPVTDVLVSYDSYSSFMPSKYARKTFVSNGYNSSRMEQSSNNNIRGGKGDSTQYIGGISSYINGEGTTLSGRQGPCPLGYHVPSVAEWSNVAKGWLKFSSNPKNWLNASNDLLLPSAGYIQNNNLALTFVYQGGTYLWTSSNSGNGDMARYIAFNGQEGVTVTRELTAFHSYGKPVRCFKNYANEKLNVHDGANAMITFTGTVNNGRFIFLGSGSRQNSIFLGWYDKDGNKIEKGDMVQSDIYAKWKCEEGYMEYDSRCIVSYSSLHTISFNTDGGSEKDDIVVPGGLPQVYLSEEKKYSHTENLMDDGLKTTNDYGNGAGNYGNNWNNSNIRGTDRTSASSNAHVLTIPGFENLIIDLYYNGESISYDWVSVRKGNHPGYTSSSYTTSEGFVTTNEGAPDNNNKFGGSQNGTFTVNNNILTDIGHVALTIPGDTVTFAFKSDSSGYGKGYGYYAIVRGFEKIFSLGENPTKKGQVFDGWYKENGEKWNEYNDIIDSDFTLYAHWRDPEAILLPGKDFNTKIKNLANNRNSTSSYNSYDYAIKNIVRSDSMPSGVETIEIQSDDSNLPIYAWYSKGTIHIYSESDIIYMNPDSSYMFQYMYGLKDLEANGFNTNKVTDMKNMFYYDQGLKTLNLSGWNISNVTNMQNMFYYASTLESLNLDGWNFPNNISVGGMFNGLYSLNSLSMKNRKIPQSMQNGLYNSFGLCNSNVLEIIDVSNWDLSDTVSLYQLFYDLYSLNEIIGLDTWDTSNIQNMGGIFSYCYNLGDINLSGWDVSHVTNMQNMFNYCKSIENLNLDGRDISNIQMQRNGGNYPFSSMFNTMNSLKNLSLKNWKIPESMGAGFNNSFGLDISNSSELEIIDVSNWDLSKTKDLYDLFYYLSVKEIVGLDTWDTSNIESMDCMFWGTKRLSNLDLSNWNTSKVTRMDYMFYASTGLNNLNLSNWNTSKVTRMDSMFYNASGLVELDLSSFDTSNVTGMSNMFYNASNLNTIYVSDKFVTTNLLSGDNMFSGTTNIVGGNGTVYDPLKFNQEYAKIDTLSQSGYFTNVLDKPYTITYNLDEGVISGEKTIYTQRDTFTLVTPIKTGFTFLGWTGSNGVIPQIEVNIQSGTVKGNLEYTANWEINQYKIAFDTDGGNEINPISVDYNSEIQNLPTPTKECNEFLGWDAELPERMPAYDITLKARWNYTCSKSSGGGGGGGGGGSSKTTNENKNIHNSADEEQKSEETSNQESLNQETSEQENTKEETLNQNTSTEEKSETIVSVVDVKTETVVVNTSTSNDSSYTPEQNEAYDFAKENGITTTSSIEQAKMNTSLKRIEMAKMLSQYAINVLGQEPDSSKGIIKFNDVTNKLDKEYDNGVTLAYQLGIMGQNMKDNNFRPNDEVTRAEFVTALSRLLYNTDEGKYKGTGKYYEPHMAKLYNEGIISKTDPKIKEKRGYVMIMLMRSVK